MEANVHDLPEPVLPKIAACLPKNLSGLIFSNS